MIAKLKNYLRRRQRAKLEDELERLRELRTCLTQQEYYLRGRLAVLGAGCA